MKTSKDFTIIYLERNQEDYKLIEKIEEIMHRKRGEFCEKYPIFYDFYIKLKKEINPKIENF